MVAAGSPVYASEHARMGCSLRRAAAQTLPDVAATFIVWDTQDADTDNLWSSGNTVTLPGAGGGVWSVSLRLILANGLTGSGLALLIVNSVEIARFAMGDQQGAWAYGLPLSAGDQVQIQAYADTAAGTTMTAALHAYRVGL